MVFPELPSWPPSTAEALWALFFSPAPAWGPRDHAIIAGYAGVAQSVEQLIRNEKVGCSIHLSGTNPKDKAASKMLAAFVFRGMWPLCSQIWRAAEFLQFSAVRR
jgi:hypothetical protein